MTVKEGTDLGCSLVCSAGDIVTFCGTKGSRTSELKIAIDLDDKQKQELKTPPRKQIHLKEMGLQE